MKCDRSSFGASTNNLPLKSPKTPNSYHNPRSSPSHPEIHGSPRHPLQNLLEFLPSAAMDRRELTGSPLRDVSNLRTPKPNPKSPSKTPFPAPIPTPLGRRRPLAGAATSTPLGRRKPLAGAATPTPLGRRKTLAGAATPTPLDRRLRALCPPRRVRPRTRPPGLRPLRLRMALDPAPRPLRLRLLPCRICHRHARPCCGQERHARRRAEQPGAAPWKGSLWGEEEGDDA